MRHIRFPNFCGVLAENVRPDLLKINDCQERVNMEINKIGEIEKRMGVDSFSSIAHGGTGQLTDAEYGGIRDLWIWYPRYSLTFNGKEYLILVWSDTNDDNIGSLYLLYYDTSTHSWLKYDTGESDRNLFDDMYRPVGCPNTYGMIFSDGRDNNPLRFVEAGNDDDISYGTVGQATPLTALSQDQTATGNIYSSGADATGMNVVKGSILQYCYTVETDTGEEGSPSPVSSDDYLQNLRLTSDTVEPEWVQVSALLSGFSSDNAINNKTLKYYRVYRRDILYTEDVIGAYPFRFVERISIKATSGRDASPYSDQELSYDNQSAPKGDDLGESGEVLFIANSNGKIQFPFAFDYYAKIEINNQNVQTFVNGIYKIRLYDEDIFGTSTGHRTMYEMLSGISTWKNLIRLFDIDQITPLPVVYDTETNIAISYIQNGDFGSSTGWTFEATGGHGWFYGSSDAYCDGANAAPVTLTGTVPGGTPLTEGDTYLITMTLANYSGSISGYLTPGLGGKSGKLMACSAGSHSFVVTAGAGSTFTLLAGINTRCRIDSITIYAWSAFIYTRIPLVPAATIHELYFGWCETALGVTDSSWQTPTYGEFVDFDTFTGQMVWRSLSRVRCSGHQVCSSGEENTATEAINRGDELEPLVYYSATRTVDPLVFIDGGKSLDIDHYSILLNSATDKATTKETGHGDAARFTVYGFVKIAPSGCAIYNQNPLYYLNAVYSTLRFESEGDVPKRGWAIGFLKNGAGGLDKAAVWWHYGDSLYRQEITLDASITAEKTLFILFSVDCFNDVENDNKSNVYLYIVDSDLTVYYEGEIVDLITHPITLTPRFVCGISHGFTDVYEGISITGAVYDQVNLINNVYVKSLELSEQLRTMKPRFASEWIGWDGTENRSCTFDPAQAIYDDSPIGILQWSATGGRSFPPLNYARFPEEIIKIIPVRLLYQSTYAMSILVFTRSGYYRMILDGTSGEWRSKISQILIDEQSQYSTPYADSFIIVGDYVYFVNEHGIYRTYVNSGSPANISKGYVDLPAAGDFDYRLAVYVPQRDQILFHFEDVGTPANNETLVLDLQETSDREVVWHRFTGMSIRGGDILRETDYNIFIDTNAGSSLLKQYPGSSYTTESAYVRSAKIEVGTGRLCGYCFDYTGVGSIVARAYSTKLSGGFADTTITPSGADESVAVPPGVIGKFFDFVLTGETVKSFYALISDRG